MPNKGGFNLRLEVPPDEVSLAKFLTQSGTFRHGDLLVNLDGIRIVPQTDSDAERVTQLVFQHILELLTFPLPLQNPYDRKWDGDWPPPPIKPLDNQISLADVDTIKVIGKGSGGLVQLVQHKWTNQFFALKVIQMNIEESARKQTAQELKINQSLECPYVVACYQCVYQNEAFSIILEYMDGGSLVDLLKKVKTIPEEYLAAICKQVVRGMYYLHHKKHIIHRDLKPSNLLINHRGEVKITDFGVSAIVESTSAQANTKIGTYHYMAPERFIEENYGAKSDIWSFGLVVLECATGKFPYPLPEEDDGWINYFSIMQTIIEQPPPCAPSDLFSPEFCSFVSSCLQKDPKARLSAQQLMEHSFLSMYDDLHIDLASYFSNAGSPLTTL